MRGAGGCGVPGRLEPAQHRFALLEACRAVHLEAWGFSSLGTGLGGEAGAWPSTGQGI